MVRKAIIEPVENGYTVDIFTTGKNEFNKRYVAKDEKEVVDLMKRNFKKGDSHDKANEGK